MTGGAKSSKKSLASPMVDRLHRCREAAAERGIKEEIFRIVEGMQAAKYIRAVVSLVWLGSYLSIVMLRGSWASIVSRVDAERRRGLCRMLRCFERASTSVNTKRSPSSSRYFPSQAEKMLKAGC